MTPEELFTKSEFDNRREHPEFHETVRCADYLRGEIHKGKNVQHVQRPFPGIRFTHFPAESGDGTSGFFAKRMGLDIGWSDFIFLWGPPAKTGFIELKVVGKDLKPKQKQFFYDIEAMGFDYKAKCFTTEQVRDTLISWKIPYKPCVIQPKKMTFQEQMALQAEIYRSD